MLPLKHTKLKSKRLLPHVNEDALVTDHGEPWHSHKRYKHISDKLMPVKTAILKK